MKDVPAARSAASIKTPDRLKNDTKLLDLKSLYNCEKPIIIKTNNR